MRHKFILLTVILLAGPPAFADIFPLIRVNIESKSVLDKPVELVKLFGNPSLFDKSLSGRIRVNNRLKEHQKNKDPFKRRQRPFWNRRPPGKGIPGVNYTMGFLIAKKVIFRPRNKDK